MLMDQELSGGVIIDGLRYSDHIYHFFPDSSTMNGFKLQQQLVDGNRYISFQQYKPPIAASPPAPASGSGTELVEESDYYSNINLNYISRMLMEEDIDEKVSSYQEESALRAAEKPFYDILSQKYTPPPDQLYSSSNLESPGDSTHSSGNVSYGTNSRFIVPFPESYSLETLFCSSSSVGNGAESVEKRLASLPAWQFRRGLEEAQKFLPGDGKLVIDLEAKEISFSQQQQQQQQPRGDEYFKVEDEDREYTINWSRGRKNPSREDLAAEEGRSTKQSAISSGGIIRSKMFDSVLLCYEGKCRDMNALRESLQREASRNSQNSSSHPSSKASNGVKARGKKQPKKKEVVDLRTLLIHCAQAVAADDRRSANEMLKQIRQHSSPTGDGTQRLAHCFADGLEARLAGTGSQIYKSLVAKRTAASAILKGYHLYLAACPFKRISHFMANQTIQNLAGKAARIHIVDFGIYFGFQWPSLIQRLASIPGGAPKLRITGIDVTQPGFRPTERIEETGRRLADYARSFNVPFEYNPIASKWENIRAEDLNIDKDEVVIVNCLYRFRNLVDETVVVDSPRNMVLNTIRKMNPTVFIHGIVNGSYGAPFFVTRFREALFHYSSLFDMLETNVPREDAERLLIERDLFGREALNVIACEGSERVERPETYKQWQVRNLRAGFEQLPLRQDLMKKARERVRGSYHKDFLIDEDSQWLLQGWKGRIIYALSMWKPSSRSAW